MRNLLLSFLIIINLVAFIPAISYAQDATDTNTTTEQQATTLSDSLTTAPETANGGDFGIILIAVITPILLFVLAYFIIKMTKS